MSPMQVFSFTAILIVIFGALVLFLMLQAAH